MHAPTRKRPPGSAGRQPDITSFFSKAARTPAAPLASRAPPQCVEGARSDPSAAFDAPSASREESGNTPAVSRDAVPEVDVIALPCWEWLPSHQQGRRDARDRDASRSATAHADVESSGAAGRKGLANESSTPGAGWADVGEVDDAHGQAPEARPSQPRGAPVAHLPALRKHWRRVDEALQQPISSVADFAAVVRTARPRASKGWYFSGLERLACVSALDRVALFGGGTLPPADWADVPRMQPVDAALSMQADGGANFIGGLCPPLSSAPAAGGGGGAHQANAGAGASGDGSGSQAGTYLRTGRGLLFRIARLARALPQALPPTLPLLTEQSSIRLTQYQCAVLLAACFVGVVSGQRRVGSLRDLVFPDGDDGDADTAAAAATDAEPAASSADDGATAGAAHRGRRRVRSRVGPLPHFSMQLFVGGSRDPCAEHKLRCLLAYFARATACLGPRAQGCTLVFSRLRRPAGESVLWAESRSPLAPLRAVDAAVIEDAVRGRQGDFANKFIGGGVLGHGCVQEEIRFLISPELIVSLLFTPVMADPEAVILTGSERVSAYRGYGASFAFAGHLADTGAVAHVPARVLPRSPHRLYREAMQHVRRGNDVTAAVATTAVAAADADAAGVVCVRACEVVAFDALVFRSRWAQYAEQYAEWCMEREATKAHAACLPTPFEHHLDSGSARSPATAAAGTNTTTTSSAATAASAAAGDDDDDGDDAASDASTAGPSLRPLVTGNWGCGVFGGHRPLKALLQWVAASAEGRPVLYCTLDSPPLCVALNLLAAHLAARGVVARDLWRALLALSRECERRRDAPGGFASVTAALRADVTDADVAALQREVLGRASSPTTAVAAATVVTAAATVVTAAATVVAAAAATAAEQAAVPAVVVDAAAAGAEGGVEHATEAQSAAQGASAVTASSAAEAAPRPMPEAIGASAAESALSSDNGATCAGAPACDSAAAADAVDATTAAVVTATDATAAAAGAFAEDEEEKEWEEDDEEEGAAPSHHMSPGGGWWESDDAADDGGGASGDDTLSTGSRELSDERVGPAAAAAAAAGGSAGPMPSLFVFVARWLAAHAEGADA